MRSLIKMAVLVWALFVFPLQAKRTQANQPHGVAARALAGMGTSHVAETYDASFWRTPLSEMNPLTQDWVSQSSGVFFNLYAVKAVSANVAWACGDLGTVLRTTDGGGTWTKAASPTLTLSCYSIDAFDANTAWVAAANPTGGNSALYKTIDGGSTWTQQLASNDSTSFYDAVRFYDPNNGIMLGDPENGYFVIYTTTDGGTNWTRTLQSSFPAPISGEYGLVNNLAVFGNNAWFGTGYSSDRIFRSTDRGTTWSASGPVAGLGSEMSSTSFANDTIGLELGLYGKVVQTKDGGKSWSNAILTGATYSTGVVFVTPTIAIVVGYGYASTTDAGSNWTFSSLVLLYNPNLTAVSFASSSVGWAVGQLGTVLKWNGGTLGGAPLVTTDAASNVSSSSSILNATVRPNGLSTTACFEWGTSSTLSNFNTTAWLSIGSGISEVSVNDTLNGLSGNTTYYYRAVGQNSVGTEKGSIVGFTTAPTLVERIGNEVPRQYALSQNYPNPFNPSTTIELALPHNEFVTLKLFNLLGEETATLLSERVSAGRYQVQWNAGREASGVYFYRLVAGSYVETKKMLLLR